MIHAVLGKLIAYPEPDYSEALGMATTLVVQDSTEPARKLVAFRAGLHDMTLDQIRELYTITFDLNPVAALEVGWHLYGDTYERGKFLVLMRGLLAKSGLEEHGELPDHLTHVLPLLGRLPEEDAAGLAINFVIPALEKMLAKLRDSVNPYRHLLAAIQLFLTDVHAAQLSRSDSR